MTALFVADVASAGTVAVTGHIQGAGRIVNVEAGPYNCDKSANLNENATAQCDRETFGAVFSAYVKMRAVPRSTPAGHWRFVGWTGCQALTENGQVCEVNSAWDRLDERHPRAIFADDHAPNVQITNTSFPANRTVRVAFSTNEGSSDGGRTECRLDDGGWDACSGSRDYGGLAEGQHTVWVRGTDSSNQSETESTTFQIADTAIANGPPEGGRVKTRVAGFGFSSANATGYECSVTQAAAPGGWQACPNPFTATVPADGEWRLFVRARNGAFADPEPAVRRWIVDTVAPRTTLDPNFGPRENAIQAATTETFAFTADEQVERFECKLDGGGFQPCASPRTVTNLGAGQHTFEVRAVDLAGNVGAAVARNWHVAEREVDDDGDGFSPPDDCDDSNARINKTRPDIPDNGVDENCDGRDAENLDRDADGVPRPADCNDSNAAINPLRRDIPENGVDENCDGRDAVNLDRDGDGHDRPADCDDANAGVHPGVRDVPGNGRDENCDGTDAAYPFVNARISWRATVLGRPTVFHKLAVLGVPVGATVEVSCKGKNKAKTKRCLKRKLVIQRSGDVKLKRLLGRRLPARSVIEIRVTHPEMVGIVRRLKLGRGRQPKSEALCVVPGKQAAPC
jgi:hypothetical protein